MRQSHHVRVQKRLGTLKQPQKRAKSAIIDEAVSNSSWSTTQILLDTSDKAGKNVSRGLVVLLGKRSSAISEFGAATRFLFAGCMGRDL